MPIVAPDTLHDGDSVFPQRRVTYAKKGKKGEIQEIENIPKPITCSNHYKALNILWEVQRQDKYHHSAIKQT